MLRLPNSVHLPGLRASGNACCVALVGLIGLWGPVGQAEAQGSRLSANLVRGCVERFDAAADYFPDKAAIEDAANFSVEYRKSYKVVSLKGARAGDPVERYVLALCGTPPPALVGALAGAQLVTVPVSSLFAFSATHLALLDDLGRPEVLTGVSRLDMFATPAITTRLKSGKVAEFARTGLIIDAERVVTSKPGVFMAGSSTSTTLAVLRSAGIPVVANTEWLEPTALGRAEWLKYMALFLNEERKAESLFAAMKGRYRALSARATALPASQQPLVMAGRSTRGTFTIAGGRSYVAALIKDAGGRYAWPDNTAVGSAPIDLEAQIQRAANADIWINGGGWASLAAMLDDEPRYAAFRAFRQKQVWVYERQMTATGENDYWSRSVTHPDLVLADLIEIFHPKLLSGRTFEWYMPVPDR